jgi:hypothetical protein
VTNATYFYIYALKDPRLSPARPFYIGKGTGTRAWNHLVVPDSTPKGRRIAAIQSDKAKVLVTILADGLSEGQAIKLEAELIAAFGTEATGGPLTNTVIPSGLATKVRKGVVVPTGVREKAQLGLSFIKDAILELARANNGGITNADASKVLGLQSDYGGGSKDYLAYSILGLLMREGKMRRENRGQQGYHVAQV